MFLHAGGSLFHSRNAVPPLLGAAFPFQELSYSTCGESCESGGLYVYSSTATTIRATTQKASSSKYALWEEEGFLAHCSVGQIIPLPPGIKFVTLPSPRRLLHDVECVCAWGGGIKVQDTFSIIKVRPWNAQGIPGTELLHLWVSFL